MAAGGDGDHARSDRPCVGFRDCDAVIGEKAIEGTAESLLLQFEFTAAYTAPEGVLAPFGDSDGFCVWRDIGIRWRDDAGLNGGSLRAF
jgi:hypothetical protein